MDNNRRSKILEEIASIIRTEVNKPDVAIGEKTTARDVPGWDSLAHINIIIAVEARFGLKMRSAEVGKIQDVAGLVDIVLERGRLQD